MTVSDYIVDFFCKKAINHFFVLLRDKVAFLIEESGIDAIL